MAGVRRSELLKRIARPVLRFAGPAVAGSILYALRLTRRRAGVALMYHGVAEHTGDPRMELVPPHGADLFASELRYLARSYRIVPAAELLDAAARRRRGERFPAAITFDDDVASHASLALPILRRTQAHATFFLTGASLVRPSSFWWQRLQQAVDREPDRLASLFAAVGAAAPARLRRESIHELGRYVESLEPAAREVFADSLPGDEREGGLSADGVRALVSEGMAIGFHTRRHHVLPALDEAALARAFKEGRAELEAVAGGRLTTIAYPYGRADERVAAAARRAGFSIGYTGVSGPVQPGDDPLLLRRIDPSYRSEGHLALQLVAALLRPHAGTAPGSGSR